MTVSGTRATTTNHSRRGEPPRRVVWISALVGLLGLIVSITGVALAGDSDPKTVVTIHGESIQLYGNGVYEHDTLFQAANNQSTDLVMLLFGLPLLAGSLFRAAKGSDRGALVLVGILGFYLYVAAGYALGAMAYNEFFLLYVVFFSASLFAFVMTFAWLRHRLAVLGRGLPTRLPGIFMLASSLLTLTIWLMNPVASLLDGEVPGGLDIYSTLFTTALDIAVIVPAAAMAGVMVLRHDPVGYLIAFSLLVLEALLLPMIGVATVLQMRLGISFTPPELVGPIAGFAVLAAVAIWVMVSLLRRVEEPDPASA